RPSPTAPSAGLALRCRSTKRCGDLSAPRSGARSATAGWWQADCRRGRTRGEQHPPCVRYVLYTGCSSRAFPPLPAAGTQNLSRPRQKAQRFVDNIYCARKLPTKNRLTGVFSVLLLSTVAAVVSQDFGGLRGFLRVRRA